MAGQEQLLSMIPDRRHEMDWEHVQVDFSVSQHNLADITVLTVHGEVDVYSAPSLGEHLSASLSGPAPTVVVDLSEVEFMDSTGLGALVSARTTAADADGRLPLVCQRERLLKLFQITGLDGVFEIHPTVDAAVAALAPNSPTG